MSTVEVDDTDTGSANSDDSLDPDPCVYEEFFDCDNGSLDLGDDFYDADDGSNFPPPLKDYKPRDSSQHPTVGFNEGRDKVWEQCMEEVDLLCDRIGIKGEGRQGLFEIEFGEGSELYAKCKKIGVDNCAGLGRCDGQRGQC